jgi:hypothetical protein
MLKEAVTGYFKVFVTNIVWESFREAYLASGPKFTLGTSQK